MHKIYRQQIVPAPLEKVWAFIRDPSNLNRITPEFLDFKIVSDVPLEMMDGLLIEYRIRLPWMGTQKWLTEIKHIRPGKSFVDEQRIGPYKFWYHYHELTETGQGVRIIDDVTYALPFGFVGRWVNRLIVRKTLDRIFDDRSRKLSEILDHG